MSINSSSTTTPASDRFFQETVVDPLIEMIPPHAMYIVACVDLLILVVGVVGNSLTIAVIALNRYMRTVTNYYLLNLAVTDLMFLVFSVPYEITTLWKPFHNGFDDELCLFTHWISETFINVSVLTITAFSIERYLAICKPFKIPPESRVVKIIAVIWIISAIVGYLMASLVFRVPVGEKEYCWYNQGEQIMYVVGLSVSLVYVLPGVLLTVLYTIIAVSLVKSSRMEKNVGAKGAESGQEYVRASTNKSLKMLVAVVVAFFVCWAPLHTERLITAYTPVVIKDRAAARVLARVSYYIVFLAHVFYLVSAAINPIIYSILSKKFRDAFGNVIKKVYCGKK